MLVLLLCLPGYSDTREYEIIPYNITEDLLNLCGHSKDMSNRFSLLYTVALFSPGMTLIIYYLDFQ